MFFLGYFLILAVDRVAAQKFHMKYNTKVSDDTKALTHEDVVKANANTNTADAGVEMQPIASDAQAKTDGTQQTAVHVSKTAAIILVLAIGVHALFEGIALGLQKEIEEVGQLGAGIIIHKSAAAASLGGAFTRTGYTLKQIILFIVLFALTTPIGILIGMAITESNALIDTIFMGLSGGTFIYVACSEIIVAEFNKGIHNWIKMILVLLGGAVITFMWFFGEHHHHGEEGHGAHAGHHLLM